MMVELLLDPGQKLLLNNYYCIRAPPYQQQSLHPAAVSTVSYSKRKVGMQRDSNLQPDHSPMAQTVWEER
jgi:hypothetical protein